jgi:hypothetical protein
MTDMAPDPASGADPTGATGIYSTRAKLVIVAVLVLAGAAFGLAFVLADTGVEEDPVATGTAAAPLEGFRLQPAADTQALRQAEIGIDLEPGWEGTLVVDGVQIPDEELRIVEAENQVYFTPGEGRSVERLPGGRNCVTAIFWQTQVGRGVDDGQISWCFEVL